MIYLLNYDAGNLLSLKRAIEFNKFNCSIIKKLDNISPKDIIIIPGVGSFYSAALRIKESGIFRLIKRNPKDRPFILGICLGMQLLMSIGTEGNTTDGINLIEGGVYKIIKKKPKNIELPKTLISWEKLYLKENISDKLFWLKNHQNEYFYHVHSYMCCPTNSKNIFSTYTNKLSFIPNIIGDIEKRVLGFQFHPEKSGESGLKILKEAINFGLRN